MINNLLYVSKIRISPFKIGGLMWHQHFHTIKGSWTFCINRHGFQNFSLCRLDIELKRKGSYMQSKSPLHEEFSFQLEAKSIHPHQNLYEQSNSTKEVQRALENRNFIQWTHVKIRTSLHSQEFYNALKNVFLFEDAWDRVVKESIAPHVRLERKSSQAPPREEQRSKIKRKKEEVTKKRKTGRGPRRKRRLLLAHCSVCASVRELPTFWFVTRWWSGRQEGFSPIFGLTIMPGIF